MGDVKRSSDVRKGSCNEFDIWIRDLRHYGATCERLSVSDGPGRAG
jgi:hypothetical protein